MSTLTQKATAPTIAIVANSCIGIYQFRLGLIDRLVELGYRVVCIALEDEFSSLLLAKGHEVHIIDVDMQSMGWAQNLALVRRLKKAYADFNVDLAIHYTIKPITFGAWAARSHNIPILSVVTGLGRFPDLPKGIKKFLIQGLYGWASRVSNETWFLNTSDRDFFKRRKWVSAGGARVLSSEGVNLERYAYASIPDRPGVPLHSIYIGRLLVSKGITDYVDAIRMLRRDGYPVIGRVLGFINREDPDSITYQQLQAWVDEGLINYLGTTDDIRPYLENADILVLPTYYREGANRTILEALAVGRPVVTCKGQVGAGELVRHLQTGYHVPPRDPSAIALALEHFIELPKEERTQMSTAARRYVVREHNEKDIVPIYIDTIDRLLGASLGSRYVSRKQSRRIHVDKTNS